MIDIEKQKMKIQQFSSKFENWWTLSGTRWTFFDVNLTIYSDHSQLVVFMSNMVCAVLFKFMVFFLSVHFPYPYIADFNSIFLKIFQVSFYIIPTIKLPTICHPTRQIPDVSGPNKLRKTPLTKREKAWAHRPSTCCQHGKDTFFQGYRWQQQMRPVTSQSASKYDAVFGSIICIFKPQTAQSLLQVTISPWAVTDSKKGHGYHAVFGLRRQPQSTASRCFNCRHC